MRKIVALALGALALPLACTSSSDTPPAQGLDAGEGDAKGPPFDGGGLPDIDVPDQSTPGVDSGPPPVTVLVLRGGLPASGVIVVFGDTSGAMTFADKTGQDGKISHAVDPDAMVTALLGGAGRREIVTFVGVKPGDALTAIDPSPSPTGLAANLALDPTPPGGTVSYVARVGSCQQFGGTSPINVPLADGCFAAGKFPALVESHDEVDTTIGFSFKKGNALAVDAGTDVTLGAWSTTFGDATIAVTNAPQPPASFVAQLNEVADRVSTAFRANIEVTGGAGSVAFRSHTGFADAFQPQVNVFLGAANGQAQVGIMGKHVAAGTNVTQSFDLSQLLPTITAVTVDLTQSTRPKVTWTSSAALTSADGGVVRIAGVHDAGDAGPEDIEWTFIVPPGAASVTAPVLTAGSPWTPNKPTFNDLNVVFVESDLLPSYDALRNGLTAFPLPAFVDPFATVLPPLPMDGSVRVSANVPQPL